jgi:hypothetical protein
MIRIEVRIDGSISGGGFVSWGVNSRDTVSWGTYIRRRVFIGIRVTLVWLDNNTTEVGWSTRHYNSNIVVADSNDFK